MRNKPLIRLGHLAHPPLVVIDHGPDGEILIYADTEVAVIDRTIERDGEEFWFEEYRPRIPDSWREAIGGFREWDPELRALERARMESGYGRQISHKRAR